MSVVNELNSIYDFLKATYSTATIERQDVPGIPVANSFVVRLQYNDTQTETRFSYRNDREFQAIYFGKSSVDVLIKVDELSRLFNNGNFAIPIRDSLRYIRVKGFSFTAPFKSASGVDAVIAVMQTETREARDFETYEKIMSVNAGIKE